MNHKDILCPYCKSQTHLLWYLPEKKIAKIQCNRVAEHKFKIDEEGNVIKEIGRCKDSD